jgi:hypothetical protein
MRGRMIAAGALALALLAPAAVGASTIVPGQAGRYDADNNGIPDEGVVVTGKYTSTYAYDQNGDWYWDLGDGRVQGTVGSVDDLDQDTLDVCDYQVQYRGSFENTPFLDTGWIKNNIVCRGYSGTATYNSVIVHRSDPRFKGHEYGPGWGPDWEYFVDTWSGVGNVANPHHPWSQI